MPGLILTSCFSRRGPRQAEHDYFDGCIRAAVEGRDTQRGEGVHMHACAVAFVLGEAVAWVIAVVPAHDVVAGHLGDIYPLKTSIPLNCTIETLHMDV